MTRAKRLLSQWFLGVAAGAAIALPTLLAGVCPGPSYAQSAPPSATNAAAEAALNQGLVLIEQGQVDGALAQFQQAAALDPNLAAAHYNIGLALRQNGQLQEAAAAFP